MASIELIFQRRALICTVRSVESARMESASASTTNAKCSANSWADTRAFISVRGNGSPPISIFMSEQPEQRMHRADMSNSANHGLLTFVNMSHSPADI